MNTINRYESKVCKVKMNNEDYQVILYADCNITPSDYSLNVLKQNDGYDNAEMLYSIRNESLILDQIKIKAINKLIIDGREMNYVTEDGQDSYKNLNIVISKGTIVVGRGCSIYKNYPYLTIFDYNNVFVITIASEKITSITNISGSVQLLRDEIGEVVDIGSAKKVFNELPVDERNVLETICSPDDYFEYALT